MATRVTFRSGRPSDSSDCAILLDMASRRLSAWLWSTQAEPGQSWHDVGRARIRGNEAATSYYTNWWLAEGNGETLGGFFGFMVPDPYDQSVADKADAVLKPLAELEGQAAGCWLLQAIAVFPEFRGGGLGGKLIETACEAARNVGATRIALQVASSNEGAVALFRRAGFQEWRRQPFVEFPGTDDSGEWILMLRDL